MADVAVHCTARITDFDINPIGLAEFFSLTGPLRDYMDDAGARTALAAQALCPVESLESAIRYRERGGPEPGTKWDPKVDPGRLQRSIEHQLGTRDGIINTTVGSELAYARRQEFTHPTQNGFLRKALAAVGGPHAVGPGKPKDVDVPPAASRRRGGKRGGAA